VAGGYWGGGESGSGGAQKRGKGTVRRETEQNFKNDAWNKKLQKKRGGKRGPKFGLTSDSNTTRSEKDITLMEVPSGARGLRKKGLGKNLGRIHNDEILLMAKKWRDWNWDLRCKITFAKVVKRKWTEALNESLEGNLR